MTMEKVLRIPVAELTRLRVTCRKCETAVELPLDQASRRLRSTDCPFCSAQLFAHDRPTAAAQFAQAVSELLREAESVTVELILPATD